MNSPLFSVIIPTYNRDQTLSRAIDSVLAQTYESWELLIIDDGSTDGTSDILAKYAQDPRIRIYSTENLGVSHARNFGAKMARGSWLAFLDSDDEWFDFKLSKQEELLKKEGLPLVHGEEVWIRNGTMVKQPKKYQKRGGDQFLPSLNLCALSPSTVAIKKEFFFELGGFRQDFPVCEDYDLWLKLTSLSLVSCIKEPLIKKHGGHEDQLSTKFKAMDYWRVKSLVWILENRDLSEARLDALKKVLNKKIAILLNGYEKHGNLDSFAEISEIKKALNLG